MTEDYSLDEFAGGDADGGAESSPGDDERETGGGSVDADDVDADGEATADADPATPTATWTTDGAACDRCGESVARRWFDDGALVCPACKEW
ncbi:hypothetical protein ACFQMF_01980 [Halorubrum rutilum]|uniref:DUF7573 domain-containing protein n=1 Tax=Halorubrum rutilum TaxID=1364933 RepID=A0ABD6AHC7_9EURY|nr:hypothetical protein [Halorubrum rutilum]